MGIRKITNAELYLELVKREPTALIEDIPEKFITAELCLEAVKSSGLALRFVPDELKTAELCFEAVKSMIEEVLGYVPKGLRNEVLNKIKSGE
jgi:hypothetical protein